MKYCCKTTEHGNLIDIEIYPCREGGTFRRLPSKRSSAAQQSYNRRQRAKHLCRLANCNFARGDYWLTLTFSSPPSDAQREVANYLRRLKRRCPIKYLYVIGGECGERSHCHMLLKSSLDAEKIGKLWTAGAARLRRLNFGRYDITGVALYMAKHIEKGRYYPSHGLKQPRTSIKGVSRAFVNKLLCGGVPALNKAFKGFETLVFNEPQMNDFCGGVFLSCQMRRQC